MRVCVVGAGFAGLSAAVELARRDIDVVVLEARARVGGRVWSQTLPTSHGDVVVERGAEFVLDGYDRLRARVADAGLELVDTGMSYYRREVHDLPADELRRSGLQLMEAARQVPAGTDVAAVIDALPVPPLVAEALRARVEISCAAEAGGLDAAVVEHVASFSSRPSHRIGGGNQRLAEALAAELGERVHTSRAVRAVADHDHEVLVRTDHGDEVADRVVLAVPAPVLGTLTITPPLPDSTADAYRALAYGHAAKLHVPLRRRPPSSAVMSVPDRYWTWTPAGPDGRVGAAVHAFAGSRAALDALEVDAGPTTWVRRLEALRGDLALVAEEAIVTTWSDDPWARGAYSAWAAGGRFDDDRLRAPVGRIHLAGEHTAGEWSGLMEGALRSGERVAAEIADAGT